MAVANVSSFLFRPAEVGQTHSRRVGEHPAETWGWGMGRVWLGTAHDGRGPEADVPEPAEPEPPSPGLTRQPAQQHSQRDEQPGAREADPATGRPTDRRPRWLRRLFGL